MDAMNVLLVEDDVLIRSCLAEVLADAGMRVAEASSAGEALRLADADPPGVLVTDLNLGAGMGGRELASAAHRRWPSLRVVLISGGEVEEAKLPPNDRFLAKPFRGSDLVQAVRG